LQSKREKDLTSRPRTITDYIQISFSHVKEYDKQLSQERKKCRGINRTSMESSSLDHYLIKTKLFVYVVHFFSIHFINGSDEIIKDALCEQKYFNQ
jgi:hypothetical protein